MPAMRALALLVVQSHFPAAILSIQSGRYAAFLGHSATHVGRIIQQGSAFLLLILCLLFYFGGAGAMPYSLRALLSVMLVVGYCQCALAESSSWWPFGEKEEPPVAAAASTTTAPMLTPSPGLPPSSAITPVGPELPTPQTGIPQAAAPQAALSNYPPASSLPKAAPPVVAKDSDRPPLLESPIELFK